MWAKKTINQLLQRKKQNTQSMLWTTTPLRSFISSKPSHHHHHHHKPYHSTLFSSSQMDNPTPPSTPPPTQPQQRKQTSLIFLHGKSSIETEFAHTLKSNNTLKLPDDELEVSVLVQNAIEDTTFQVDLYMNSLTTRQFGKFLIYSPRLSSTQDLVYKNFKEIPIGSVCVADVQFKGRGRSNNLWESPKGCLLFSFTLQMRDGRVVPLLQYVVCLAMVEAIKDVCNAKGYAFIDVRIKWPNDLYLNGVKVGGILCNSSYGEKRFNVSVGVGLNVDNEMPTTCLNKVLKELSERSYRLKREEILAAFFKRFEDFHGVFVKHGFQDLEQMYYRAWLHTEQRVVIQEKFKDGELEEEVGVEVTIQGLTSTGYLLAVDDDNQLYELHPDGNSLDFFKGLVRKKLE